MRNRWLQVAAVLFAAVTMLGAASPGRRFDKIGHQLMCTCGCGEILLECNHMGCPDSPGLIADLKTQVTAGTSNSSVLHWFADRYGPTVLAAPIRGGFDLVAWIVPFAILAIGIVAILWLLRHWKDRHEHAAGTPATVGIGGTYPAGLRERIRRETSDDL